MLSQQGFSAHPGGALRGVAMGKAPAFPPGPFLLHTVRCPAYSAKVALERYLPMI
jgi:hypothetical protein